MVLMVGMEMAKRDKTGGIIRLVTGTTGSLRLLIIITAITSVASKGSSSRHMHRTDEYNRYISPARAAVAETVRYLNGR